MQGLHGVEAGGLHGRINPEDQADEHGHRERQQQRATGDVVDHPAKLAMRRDMAKWTD